MKVFITSQIATAGVNVLNIYNDRLELVIHQGAPLTHAQLKSKIKGVSALVCNVGDKIDKEIIESAGSSLKVISAHSTGYDNIDLNFATKKNIFVGNTPGKNTESVAEHALALMMAVGRNICTADKYCREGNHKYWDVKNFIGAKFSGKTLGIIGFGQIGQHFAKIAKYGLGMKILYTDVIAHPESEQILDAKKVDLDTLLENSDVVSVNCRLYEDTKHLLGEKEFKKMKPLAYLINTARGPIVDEKALTSALKQNWISGAGLDVFEKEPNISIELRKLENVVITPHIGSATMEVRIQMSRMSAENVIDVLINNKPPRYLVNTELVPSQNSINSLT